MRHIRMSFQRSWTVSKLLRHKAGGARGVVHPFFVLETFTVASHSSPMAKAKRKFVCQQCGTLSSRWQGQCDDCGEWNSIVEEASETIFSARHDLQSGGRALTLVGLNSQVELPQRTSTGIAEFDRALGGGIVPGSATLIGGDPGIGKSTLLLQAAARIAARGLSVALLTLLLVECVTETPLTIDSFLSGLFAAQLLLFQLGLAYGGVAANVQSRSAGRAAGSRS